MIKNYVLDTNILLQDSEAFMKFEDNRIWIPYAVLDELDNLKNSKNSETAYEARRANRVLKEIMNNERTFNGKIFFEGRYNPSDIPEYLDGSKHDHIIIATAKYIDSISKDENIPTILVTSDISMSIKAMELFNVKAEDYKNQQIEVKYKGRTELSVNEEIIDGFYQSGEADIDKIAVDEKLYPNEFVLLKAYGNDKSSALGYYCESEGKIKTLSHRDHAFSGVVPANIGQRFAKEALLRGVDDAPLCILHGPAGTAKTFLALAAGLEGINNGTYRQILLLRPQSFFDSEIGYLPGNEQEKIDPLIRPFWDNLSRIFTLSGIRWDRIRDEMERYVAYEQIRAESFAYIRGRSITDSYIIVDEAQNTTRLQMLGAITRAGVGSKMIITGDTEQIDNTHLDKHNNGLAYLINGMKNSPLAWQVSFSENECRRSALAKDAINRLN